MDVRDPVSRNVKAGLDETVVNIELTLISIIQAVPLGILADRAVDPMMRMDWPVMLYLGVGVLSILLFWSRALIHTLSFIGWPLDFTHNFLYILSTLVQSIVISQIANPRAWFGLWIVYSVMLWIMYAVDLRMIRAKVNSEREVNGQILLRDVLEDQIRNVRFYIPAAFLFNVGAWFVLTHWPEQCIEGGGHLVCVALQLVLGGIYLWEGYAILRRRNERILQRDVDALE